MEKDILALKQSGDVLFLRRVRYEEKSSQRSGENYRRPCDQYRYLFRHWLCGCLRNLFLSIGRNLGC